jgi:hypothetical protein
VSAQSPQLLGERVPERFRYFVSKPLPLRALPVVRTRHPVAAFSQRNNSMASLSKDSKSNAYRLSFFGLDKKKKSVWLGDFTKKMAETARTNVEHLLAASAAGVAPELHTSRWLGDIGPEIRKRLAKAGLFELSEEESQEPVLLGDFLAEYVEHRADVKASTHLQYRTAIRSLLKFFGADRRLDTITPVDAERWRIHCRTIGWADNTLRRATGRAKQFFQHAVKLKAITKKNRSKGSPSRFIQTRSVNSS